MPLRTHVIAALVAPAMLAHVAHTTPVQFPTDLFAAPLPDVIEIDDVVRIDAVRVGTSTVIHRTPSKADAPIILASVAVIQN